jgi:hypothetical protein
VALKDLGRGEQAAQAERRLSELRAEDALGGKLKVQARDKPDDLDVRLKLWQWFDRNGQPEEGLSWLSEILKWRRVTREPTTRLPTTMNASDSLGERPSIAEKQAPHLAGREAPEFTHE